MPCKGWLTLLANISMYFFPLLQKVWVKWFNATIRNIVSREHLKCLKEGVKMTLEESKRVSMTLKQVVHKSMKDYMEM